MPRNGASEGLEMDALGAMAFEPVQGVAKLDIDATCYGWSRGPTVRFIWILEEKHPAEGVILTHGPSA